MGATARQSMEIADRLQNPALRAKALVDLGRHHQIVGELESSRTLYDQSIPIARSVDNRQTLSVALTYRGGLHFFQTDYQRAEEVLREAVQVASEIRDGVNLPQALFFQGLTLGNQGRITEALTKLNEAQEMSLRNGARMVASKIPNCIAWLHRELQDFEGAFECDLSALETARTYRIGEAEANALINLIHDYSDRGDAGKAAEAIEAVHAIRDRDAWHAWRFFDIRFQAATAEHCLSQGDPERAATHARLLLSNATRQWVPKYIAIAHRLLAELAIASGDYPGAAAELHASLEQLRSHPNPLVAWKVYVLLGRVRYHLGELEAAREAFSAAAAIVDRIAGSVTDENLRATFVNSAAVREVRDGSEGAASAAGTRGRA
jgi:tetratricopeptide (TPR) repeat protein